MPPRGQRRGSRLAALLVLAGVGGVLSVTFLAGVWTGRHWPALTGAARPAAPRETPGRRGGDAAPAAAPMPTLTFYQELTAPLTAPPAAAKPRPPRLAEPRRDPAAAAERPAAPAAKNETASSPAPAAKAEPKPEPAGDAAGGPFTVQVASYTARPPAEALRATLAAAGHDARVAEGEAAGTVRYRVQIGAYPTREAAREAAARLAAGRAIQTFVTTR
jgi:cell division protein FtsN